jgi:hypothetical protein
LSDSFRRRNNSLAITIIFAPTERQPPQYNFG